MAQSAWKHWQTFLSRRTERVFSVLLGSSCTGHGPRRCCPRPRRISKWPQNGCALIPWRFAELGQSNRESDTTLMTIVLPASDSIPIHTNQSSLVFRFEDERQTFAGPRTAVGHGLSGARACAQIEREQRFARAAIAVDESEISQWQPAVPEPANLLRLELAGRSHAERSRNTVGDSHEHTRRRGTETSAIAPSGHGFRIAVRAKVPHTNTAGGASRVGANAATRTSGGDSALLVR
jgi:hypothetical protein